MQRRAESLFIALKTREEAALRLQGQRPQPFVRPARPGRLWRGLMRAVPRLAQRWQLQVLRDSGLFDAAWYLEHYPDVKTAGADPARHYLLHGAADERDPGPRFSTRHYLRLYADVKASGMNPVIHYLTAGWDENRSIHPLMPEARV